MTSRSSASRIRIRTPDPDNLRGMLPVYASSFETVRLLQSAIHMTCNAASCRETDKSVHGMCIVLSGAIFYELATWVATVELCEDGYNGTRIHAVLGR